MDSDRRREYVLRTVEERGVRLIRLWFTDVGGQLKSFAISPAELENAFDEGMHFDGSSIDGYSRIQESDVLAVPDASTFELLPWSGSETSARMFCDITNLDGTPFEGDPRHILKRNLEQARKAGFTFYVAPEMEFFYFDGEAAAQGRPVPLDNGGYFDLTVADIANDLRRSTIHTLEAMGIPVEYSFHEDSPSQHEIDLRYTDALTMADTVMTFRLVVRELAQERGVYATFMPKPLEGVQGSGMHLHLSLFRGEDNAFHDASDPYGLSAEAKAFMAGLLRHARETTAVTNQLVNSYKRLIRGSGSGSRSIFEAPVYVSWGRNNQSTLVRVPPTKPDKNSSTRLEYRAPDPACNPYLAFSAVLAAGLRGIEEGYELPPEIEDNVWALSDAERAESGVLPLPGSLSDALHAMESSALMKDCLGEHVVEWFLRNKWSEWADYKAQVTPFEIDRYLSSW